MCEKVCGNCTKAQINKNKSSARELAINTVGYANMLNEDTVMKQLQLSMIYLEIGFRRCSVGGICVSDSLCEAPGEYEASSVSLENSNL